MYTSVQSDKVANWDVGVWEGKFVYKGELRTPKRDAKISFLPKLN